MKKYMLMFCVWLMPALLFAQKRDTLSIKERTSLDSITTRAGYVKVRIAHVVSGKDMFWIRPGELDRLRKLLTGGRVLVYITAGRFDKMEREAE